SGDLGDWTQTGDAFAGQPIRGDTIVTRGREPSRHAGEFWIGGYELHEDGRTGTLTSAPFVVTQPWASFLAGGGGNEQEREIAVRLVDEGTGNWGHINFDDFRLHATRPSFPRLAGVPAILPPDPI